MIYICIVTHNRRDKVQRLLDGLTDAPAEICVLANDCTDGTADVIQANTVWQSSQYLSASAARQRMVDRLWWGLNPQDVLIFLDDDIVIQDEAWLSAMVLPLNQPGVAISGIGRRITPDWMTEPALQIGPVDYVGGGWMAVRAAAFLGGLEWCLDYPRTYWDDVDLCLQARARGFEVWNCGEIGLLHDHGEVSAEAAAWCEQNREIARAKWHHLFAG